jgi:hypothetical protein
MSVYERLAKRANAFRQLTGLSVAEFQTLYEEVGGKIATYHREKLHQRERQRQVGGGGQYHNDVRDRLLMSLMWLKLYPTYEVLGFLFDLHKSNIARNLHPILHVLQTELGYEIPTDFKRGRKVTLPEFIRDFPDVVGIVDATEQAVERPQDPVAQKAHYSGKKKRHTLKTQIIVGATGEILGLSETVPGSVHDKTLYDQSGAGQRLEPDESCMADNGFQGIQHQHRARLPFKKPRGGDLTPEQKAYNRQLSHHRVVVENTLAQLKTFHLLADRYRHPKALYNDCFRLVAVFINRRLQVKPLRSAMA